MILGVNTNRDAPGQQRESRPDPIPVSVAIVTANEEHNIKDALESVRLFREIVIIDALSTDRTAEICRAYTDKFYQFPWKGYAAQKQDAVDRTSLEWVLILDADERVTPELRQEIRETVPVTAHAGFFIPRKNYFLGRWIRHSGWWPDHTLRLFRKGAGRVEMREVHEKVAESPALMPLAMRCGRAGLAGEVPSEHAPRGSQPVAHNCEPFPIRGTAQTFPAIALRSIIPVLVTVISTRIWSSM